MKKTLTGICLCICVLSLKAQKNFEYDRQAMFRFGGKAGVNINKIDGKAFSDEFSYNFMLGGFLQFNLNRRWGIQPEVNFCQSAFEATDDISDIYDDLVEGGSQKKQKLNYLKIPILVNLNVGPSQRVKLQLGPQWGQLLSSTKNASSFFEKSDFSMLGGLWLQLPFVNLGGRYEIGLSNLNHVNKPDNWGSQAFTVFVGVTF